MPQKQTATIAVNSLVINNAGEVLLIKRQNTGFCDGMYGLPAGHVDDLEMASDAMVRELQEEVNITVPASQVKQVCTMHKLQKDCIYIHYLFKVESFNESSINNNEPDKCSELKWVKLEEVENLDAQLYVKLFIKSYLENKTYVEDTTSYLQGQ